MAETIYDVAIIGSGPAGYTAAIRAGQYGLKTALIEKDNKLGGTCLHVGCIPTKALLFSADLYDQVRDGKEYGLVGGENVKIDFPAIQQRKNKIVLKHAKGLEFLMRKNKVTTVAGYGRLTGPAKGGAFDIDVENKGQHSTLKAKNVLVATGSEARMLPGMEVDDRVLSNIEILGLNAIPKSLIIVGAGAVGVEFASMYKSFGTEKVTILEMLPRLVPVEDEEISKELARAFKKRGIEFYVGAKVDKVEKSKDGVAVSITVEGKAQKIEGEKILIAVGRKPNTEGVGLDKLKNVKVERGYVHTNEWMETGEKGIYAIGDIVAGMPQLAHAGAMEGIVAVSRIAGKEAKPVKRELIPGCTYCEPQIGSVGLTEAQAREKGLDIKVGKFPLAGNSKATIVGAHEGFVKVVAGAKYGEILGVHIIGPGATETIAEAVTAMESEDTVEEMMFTVHAHPTLYESLLDGFSSVYGMAINA